MKNAQKIISKKAEKQELTKNEIEFMIKGIDSYIKDYQLSAFLMAVKINGFTNEELFHYTRALINSGKTMSLNPEFVDKHSTGGIGDKTSLIIIPILHSLGVKTFKISGRGLGFTGGTLDKLDSIPNIKYDYTLEEAFEKAKDFGAVISISNKDIVPADSYTYALRDTSGTVQSYDLIAASVMSKKIATGAKYIFIDLKVGTGAFSKDLKSAKKLGEKIKLIGENFNREVFILYSNMNEPLGRNIGNSLEIKEVIEFLKDYSRQDEKLVELIIKITSEIYSKYFKVNVNASKEKVIETLKKGKAFNSLIKLIKNQEGSSNVIENNSVFNEKFSYEVKARKDGYFFFKKLEDLGYFLIELNAGRKNKTDKLDYHSGVIIKFKNNDKIKNGDVIAKIYSEFKLDSSYLDNFENNIFEIRDRKGVSEKIIISEQKWSEKK